MICNYKKVIISSCSKRVFLPSVGETPNTWASQAQLPWQRQTSPISITSLPAQPLAQTVCASSVLKFTKASKLKLSVFPLSCDANLSQVGSDFNWFYFCPPGGADLRRGEGTSALKTLKLNHFEIVYGYVYSCIFCRLSSARHRGGIVIAARARAATAAAPETDATARNLQVRHQAGPGLLRGHYCCCTSRWQQIVAICTISQVYVTTPKHERDVW